MTRAIAAGFVAIAVAGCTRDGARTDPATRDAVAPERLTLAQTGAAYASWVVGDRLRIDGRDWKLAADVNATLIANLAPVAVPSADGKAVAYNSWRGNRPVLRIRDLSSRRESIVDEGAHSVAWARDGTLAYFKALRPGVGDPRRYLGHVVVRRAEGTVPRTWTSQPGRYVVAAWAAGRILFYRLGTSFPDLLMLERPQRQRLLARRSALVAVSPDGRHVFVSRYGASPPDVRVLDVASGAEVARLDVKSQQLSYVVESGSWTDSRVFAPTTTGVAVFRVAADAVELEQVLRAGTQFPLGLSEPRADGAGRRFMAWGALEAQPRQAVPQAALVVCDRVTLRCARATVGSAAAPPRPIYNPSRP